VSTRDRTNIGLQGLLLGALLFSAVIFPSGTGICGQVQKELVVASTHLLKPAATSSKSTCANFNSQAIISCVYVDWGGSATRQNLYEITSSDGGVVWSTPSAITSNPGDEYDPFIHYDSTRKRLWLIYAKWHDDQGGNRNDVVVRHKDCASCAWSTPANVAADGANDYWIPSILVLQDGSILAFYTKNGSESSAGMGSGTVELKRSSDGLSWGTPIHPVQICDAEYPRAIQNSFGDIMLTFSRYIVKSGTDCADGSSNGYPSSDLHQVWSSDGGKTWKGESILYHASGRSSLHPFIAAENRDPQSKCPACLWDLFFVTSDNGFAVLRMSSPDQGLSWSKPIRYSTASWPSPFNIDPGFTVGCRGLVVNYAAGYGAEGIYIRREDVSSTCLSR
jgi:BNR repeat-like domain